MFPPTESRIERASKSNTCSVFMWDWIQCKSRWFENERVCYQILNAYYKCKKLRED